MASVSNGIISKLDDADRQRALGIASTRQYENVRDGIRDRYNAAGGVRLHNIGSLCEEAFCKFKGIPHIKGERRDGDAGEYQVRGTNKFPRCLLTHPKDKDSDVFVFVTQFTDYTFAIYGWLYGWESKLKPCPRCGTKNGHWRHDIPTPAFLTPIQCLHDMKTLPELLYYE